MKRRQIVDRVARIRIELKHTHPKIWRRIDVPLSFSLLSLHSVIQAAFGWEGGHLFAFRIAGRDYSIPPHRQFGEDMFGWDDEDAAECMLHTLVERGVKRFQYTYDFGDDWIHLLTILRVLDANPKTEYPALVAGARGDPIEDVGGVWGLYEFAEAASDPKHPRRKEYEEWMGKEFLDEFDLDSFDAELVRYRLSLV